MVACKYELQVVRPHTGSTIALRVEGSLTIRRVRHQSEPRPLVDWLAGSCSPNWLHALVKSSVVLPGLEQVYTER